MMFEPQNTVSSLVASGAAVAALLSGRWLRSRWFVALLGTMACYSVASLASPAVSSAALIRLMADILILLAVASLDEESRISLNKSWWFSWPAVICILLASSGLFGWDWLTALMRISAGLIVASSMRAGILSNRPHVVYISLMGFGYATAGIIPHLRDIANPESVMALFRFGWGIVLAVMLLSASLIPDVVNRLLDIGNRRLSAVAAERGTTAGNTLLSAQVTNQQDWRRHKGYRDIEEALISAAATASLSQKTFLSPSELVNYLGIPESEMEDFIAKYKIEKIFLTEENRLWVVFRGEVDEKLGLD
jgi:hypothetical protein